MNSNTALMRLPKVAVKKKSKPYIMQPVPTTAELDASDDVVDRIWAMYQKQLKRTHEMMLLCDRIQQENDELKRAQKALAENTAITKEVKEREKKLEPITYDKLNRLTKNLKEIFHLQLPRDSYAQALVHMLYTLHQLKGQAVPDQLFASADVTEVSGFRYTGFLKRAGMLTYWASTKKGCYQLTETGKAFVQEKISTKEAFTEATGLKPGDVRR